jgi:ribosome-associated heat shock protein Hsp15
VDRVDRWLWFVRFYKTRSLAAQAVTGGRVKVNGERVKAAHVVRIGDRLSVGVAFETYEIEVRGIPTRRGPASEAQASYVEATESVQRRASAREQRRLAELGRPQSETRPDKRERRQLDKLRRNQV